MKITCKSKRIDNTTVMPDSLLNLVDNLLQKYFKKCNNCIDKCLDCMEENCKTKRKDCKFCLGYIEIKD